MTQPESAIRESQALAHTMVDVDALQIAFSILAESFEFSTEFGEQSELRDVPALLTEIAEETSSEADTAIELFDRSIALQNALGYAGVGDALGLEDGETIPDEVFEVAARIELHRESEDELVTSCFDRDEFLAALREAHN
jgi:hypothetical protein